MFYLEIYLVFLLIFQGSSKENHRRKLRGRWVCIQQNNRELCITLYYRQNCYFIFWSSFESRRAKAILIGFLSIFNFFQKVPPLVFQAFRYISCLFQQTTRFICAIYRFGVDLAGLHELPEHIFEPHLDTKIHQPAQKATQWLFLTWKVEISQLWQSYKQFQMEIY